MKKFTRRVFPVAVVIAILAGCSPSSPRESGRVRYRQSLLTFGSVVYVDICATPQDAARLDGAYRKVWQRMEAISRTMSVRRPGSDVQRINTAFPEAVDVQPATYELIQRAVDYSRLTKGAFDITVLPLIHFWQNAERYNFWPAHRSLLEAKELVGSRHIQLLEPSKVRLLTRGSAIDLGGIAKGYAVDEAVRIVREEGFRDFYVEAGGDIYTAGVNCENRPWRIGIQDPRQSKNIIGTVTLTNQAVTTSGDYERYYVVEGRRLSHIINPITGYPQSGIASATVIAPNATIADALSTALCILPVASGLEIIDSLGEDYAAMVLSETPEGRIVAGESRTFRRFK